MWKPIRGYEGLYEVSDKGEIRSLDRVLQRSDGKPYTVKGKIMQNQKYKTGYEYINLKDLDHRSKTFLVHRLVAIAFISNAENKEFVNHINAKKSDNRAENLEWCTRLENAKHAIENGLYKSKCGENSGTSKLQEWQVKEIILNYTPNKKYKEIAESYNISETQVFDILTGNLWKHLGLKAKEKNKIIRLTETQVREIKKNGKYDTYSKIAQKYKCNEETIRSIITEKTWKHILI